MTILSVYPGDVVRVAPNDLSFSTPQSVKDIYGPPSKQKKLFVKSERFYDNNPSLAYERDPERHASQAKLYQSAFRTQALRDQEHLIHQHTDTFVKQLLRLSREVGSVDMARAAEWLTFDIIGTRFRVCA